MNSPKSLVPVEVELLGKNWPEQIIPSYNDHWKLWRSQFKGKTAPLTENRFEQCGRYWCDFANGKNLTPGLMIAWHVWLSALPSSFTNPRHNRPTISVAHCMKLHGMIKRFLRWLKLVGVIDHDPSIALPILRKPEPPPAKLYLHHEYRKIVDYATGRGWLHPLLFLVTLGYHTGMGLHDCCYLRWDEVVMQENKPSYIQKGRKKLVSRMGQRAICTIPIIPGGELWVWMKKLEQRRATNYKRWDGIEYVHQDLPGLYECPRPDIQRQIKSNLLVPALGLRELNDRTFKHFRNSFCSRLINAGVDSVLVSKMTGHQNLAQLSSYVLPNLRAMQDSLVEALRWAEEESAPDMPRQFITLPSPPPSAPIQSAPPQVQSDSLASEAGERQ